MDVQYCRGRWGGVRSFGMGTSLRKVFVRMGSPILLPIGMMSAVLIFVFLKVVRNRVLSYVQGGIILIGCILYIFGVSRFLHLQIHGQSVVEWFHWLIFLCGGFLITYLCPYVWRYLVSFWIGTILISLDEILQALLPYRVGDLRDILLGLSAWALWMAFVLVLRPEHSERTNRGRLPLSAPILFTGMLVCTLVAYDVLVGLQNLPYPETNPRVVLHSRFPKKLSLNLPEPMKRVLIPFYNHERERWQSFANEHQGFCRKIIQKALSVYSHRQSASSSAITWTDVAKTCTSKIALRYRILFLVIVCFGVLSGLFIIPAFPFDG